MRGIKPIRLVVGDVNVSVNLSPFPTGQTRLRKDQPNVDDYKLSGNKFGCYRPYPLFLSIIGFNYQALSTGVNNGRMIILLTKSVKPFIRKFPYQPGKK